MDEKDHDTPPAAFAPALDQKVEPEPPSQLHRRLSEPASNQTALPEYGPASRETSAKRSMQGGPPRLDYEVFTPKRLRFIIIFWSLVIADSVFMPIGLYFGLQYGTDLSDNTLFSIVTAALGGVSIIEYTLRCWRLWKKSSTCRVIGATSRWQFDFFHWVISGMWVVVMAELIVGTTFTNPPIRLLSMPLTSLLWVFGLQMSLFEVMRLLRIPTPVRVSSNAKGSRLRPGVYSIIEDIVAVDGGGGTAYREQLDARYRASHIFRSMLERLSVFWAFGLVALAVIMTAIIFTIDPDVAYALGWSVPFVYAGICALASWWYVRRMLRIETATWATQGRRPSWRSHARRSSVANHTRPELAV